eukprot:4923570-Prymnesium_polylepis.1
MMTMTRMPSFSSSSCAPSRSIRRGCAGATGRMGPGSRGCVRDWGCTNKGGRERGGCWEGRRACIGWTMSSGDLASSL